MRDLLKCWIVSYIKYIKIALNIFRNLKIDFEWSIQNGVRKLARGNGLHIPNKLSFQTNYTLNNAIFTTATSSKVVAKNASR